MSLHSLPVQQRSMFKTATIVYKFLQSGYPNYIRALLNPRKSFYNTRSSWMAGEVEVPQFISSVHKSSKQFGFRFALILPRYGMKCLLTTTLPHLFHFFRRSWKLFFLQKPAHPRFYCIFLLSLWCGPPFVSLDYDFF